MYAIEQGASWVQVNSWMFHHIPNIFDIQAKRK